jgi:hypothetical protein
MALLVVEIRGLILGLKPLLERRAKAIKASRLNSK